MQVFSKKRLIGVVLTTAMALAVGCTKKKSNDNAGYDPKETLRLNLTTEPPSLDWSKSTDTTSAFIQYNFMEGLTEYNLDDPELSLRSALAMEWTANKDASEWTFKLREGVKWTDGKPFTAQHVVDGWKRLLEPATASEYAYFLYSVDNAKAFNEGKIKDFSQVGVKAIDDQTLKVTLNQPKSYFPYLLTHHSTYPIRLDVVATHGDTWTEPGKIVTLGAYKLKEWEHDNHIVLERNDDYYGEKAKTKYVYGYMIIENSTALNLYEKGKIDVLYTLPSREIGRLKAREDYSTMPSLGIYYYGFNTEKPPFNDPMVRKAVSMAIDRDQITTLLNGGEVPLTSWVPKGMFGYEQARGTGFDPSKAQKLLDEAGFKDRKKFPKITIGFNTNEDHQRIAENVQAQLKKTLGIQVELANEEWKTYLKSVQTNPANIFRLGWMADFPDPDNFMNLMMTESENNHTRWGNKEYDRLILEATKTTDKKKRAEMYSQAQSILVEKDVPVAPIYSMVSHYLINDRVKQFPLNSMGKKLLKDVVVE
ncbi:MAG: peptide ABC transporter substrate-binding protein [Bdellovibrionales bacterium]|nr:peptide ABC transporter substrate-binding protein [Bdellovibrionales bacterium]